MLVTLGLNSPLLKFYGVTFCCTMLQERSDGVVRFTDSVVSVT